VNRRSYAQRSRSEVDVFVPLIQRHSGVDSDNVDDNLLWLFVHGFGDFNDAALEPTRVENPEQQASVATRWDLVLVVFHLPVAPTRLAESDHRHR